MVMSGDSGPNRDLNMEMLMNPLSEMLQEESYNQNLIEEGDG